MILWKGYEVVENEDQYGDIWYYIEVDGKKYGLRKTDEGFELDFAHGVLWCKKFQKWCDYEYSKPCYTESIVASGGPSEGKRYHCNYGEGQYLSHDRAIKERPEWCNKIMEKIDREK